MGMDSFQQMHELLGEKYLLAAYDTVPNIEARGKNPMYDFYLSGPPQPTDSDRVEWVELRGESSVAKMNKRGSRANQISEMTIGVSTFGMFRVHEEFSIPDSAGRKTRSPDPSIAADGLQLIYQMYRLVGERQALQRRVVFSKLTTGKKLFIGNDMQILESTTNSGMDTDFGVPANNVGRIDRSLVAPGFGSGNIIDPYWTDPNANIILQLKELNKAQHYLGGPQIRHIWMNGDDRGLFFANANFAAWWNPKVAMPSLDKLFLMDEFTLDTFTFHFMDHCYPDASGTVRPYIPKGTAVALPDPGPWLAHTIGYELQKPVYNSVSIPANGDTVRTALDEYFSATKVYGRFAKLHVQDRGGLHLIADMGDNYGIFAKEPRAIYALQIRA